MLKNTIDVWSTGPFFEWLITGHVDQVQLTCMIHKIYYPKL